MELIMNYQEKNHIIKSIINSNKYLRKTNNASTLFFVLSCSCLLYYFCFYSLNAQIDFKALMTSTCLFVVFLILSTLSKVSVICAVKKDLIERTDEKLTTQADELIYSFRNKYETAINDRIRIHIPFNHIQEVTYNEKTKKIILLGNFQQKYAQHCDSTTMPPHRGRILSEKEIPEFVFYDYFEPSLYDYLKNRELYIEFLAENVPQEGG